MKLNISFPTVLEGQFRDDPFLRKLLGYDCETAKKALDYRKERIHNRGGNYMQDKNRIRKLRDFDIIRYNGLGKKSLAPSF